MSISAEKLRQMALATGATMKINGKLFNAGGLKLPAKRVVQPEVAPKQEAAPALETVSAMLAETIQQVARQNGLDHTALIAAIAKLQPPQKPIYNSIVPVRNADGTVKRYDLITKG